MLKTGRVDSTHLKGAALFLSLLRLKRTGPTLTSTPRVIFLTTSYEAHTDHDKDENHKARPCHKILLKHPNNLGHRHQNLLAR